MTSSAAPVDVKIAADVRPNALPVERSGPQTIAIVGAKNSSGTSIVTDKSAAPILAKVSRAHERSSSSTLSWRDSLPSPSSNPVCGFLRKLGAFASQVSAGSDPNPDGFPRDRVVADHRCWAGCIMSIDWNPLPESGPELVAVCFCGSQPSARQTAISFPLSEQPRSHEAHSRIQL